MSAREAVLEELDAAVSAPSGAAVVSGAPTCSVALLGQPNSGKSTLFNALTGSRQRVGNWPGKTVEKKEGGFSRGGVDYAVCDLPGTYSLSANSEEEVVTRDYIASGRADVVCVLADASQLERSLYMLADFAGVDCACMLVLNLMDVAEAQGKRIDAKVLERRLGIPVVPFVAADRAHCDLFYQALDRAIADPHALDATALAEACRVEFGAVYDDVRALVPERSVGALTPAWLTGKLLEGDVPVRALVDEALDERDRARLAAALFGVPAPARRSRDSTASPRDRAGASPSPSASSWWGSWRRSSPPCPSWRWAACSRSSASTRPQGSSPWERPLCWAAS